MPDASSSGAHADRSALRRVIGLRPVRRVLTVATTIIAVAVAIVTLPISVVIAVLLDRGGPWQRLRIVALIVGALIIEVIGLIGALLAWIATGFGLARRKRWTWHVHRPLMGWYTSALLSWIATVLGTDVEWRVPKRIDGPVLVLARHTSFFDAVIPGALLSRRNGLVAHHVLTDGLRWLPNLDVVGHRIPTRFIRRHGADAARQLDAIAELGPLLDERAGAVIFPEGTFRTDGRFERRMDRLRASRPDLAAQADRLRHVLPPQPAGTHALWRSMPPGTAVLICANTGLEPFGTLAQMRANLRADRPIVIEAWNVEHADIPEDVDVFSSWLLDQFRQIDAWVESQQSLS